MKTKLILPVIALLLIAGLVFGYLQSSKERAKEAGAEKPVVSKSNVERGASGDTILRLDKNAQKLLTLETIVLTNATLAPEAKGYGRVLDPSPLVALVDGVASSRAALDASSKEYERVHGLFAQGLSASAHTVESAEAAMKHDQISLETAHAQLLATWGKAVAEQRDLPAFLKSLASQQTALVRIDLPGGETLNTTPQTARLVIPGAEGQPKAEFFEPAPNVDPQMQGQAFLFLVQSNSNGLIPGRTLTAYLQLPGEPQRGSIVPDSAVVRQAARAWIYLQTAEDTFIRHEIALDRRLEAGWFVRTGAVANDRVVVQGAQALLSEEQKQQIKLLD